MISRATLILLGLSLASACSCSVSEDAPAAPLPKTDACVEGESACQGLQVKRCEPTESGLRWAAPAACVDHQICKEGSCRALTPEEEARTTSLSALLDESRDVGATARPVDYETLRGRLRERLLLGDGSAAAYVQTLWDAMLELPQGHQSIGLPEAAADEEREAAGFNLGALTRYGACLRPWADHAVVTDVDKGSVFRRGDEIMAIDGARGDALDAVFMTRAFDRDYVPPTRAGRLAFAVQSFFSVQREGTRLTVRRGTVELEVALPKAQPASAGYGCYDAFGRDYTMPAIASILPDGSGILYIPNFAEKTLEEFEAAVGPEFDKVKSTPRLVIDIRGNGGGLLKAALDLVSQFPDPSKREYCEFFERTPESRPPSYTSKSKKSVDPAGVPQPPRFAYAGKIALLIDGATHSAAEHLVLAAKTASKVIVVGTKTAGAYGTITSDAPKRLPGPPDLQLSINRSQVRRPDGAVLDGTSMDPDVEVGYEPAALARGEDPMLERALAELRK